MIAGLAFHHHGLALRRDRDALGFLETLGYALGPQLHDPVQDVRLRLCMHPSLPTVEIVMPGNAPGPLEPILARGDATLYHTCYEVDDRQTVLEKFDDAGARIIDVLPPTPAILFGGRCVSFHTILGFGLIELLDRV